jgi:hypothetical protein
MTATIYDESDFNTNVNTGAAAVDSGGASLPVSAPIKDEFASSEKFPIAYGLIGLSAFSVLVWFAAVWLVLH